MLLFSYLWLIIFDVLLFHTCFPLDVGGSGRLHISLNQYIKSVLCLLVYHQQDEKGKLCIVIPDKG